MPNHAYFSQRDYPPGEEKKLKTYYDISIAPREWMARYGHLIICGDARMYRYEDKEFEKWIYAAYEALIDEGIESLWREFLTEEEIAIARDAYENP